MKLTAEEHRLLELEQMEYRILLDNIRQPRMTYHKGLAIACTGNAGGSDSVIHGRPSGGMLIRFGNRNIIVDPGENSLSFLNAAGYDPYQITDLIASHSHNDHVGDLSSFVSSALQLNLAAKTDANILVTPSLVDYDNIKTTQYGFMLPAYAWQGNVQALYWQDTCLKRYDGEIFQSKKSFDIDDRVTITAVEARHSAALASGFIFTTPLGKLAYTGDTEYFSELLELYKGVSLLWMNMNTLSLDSINGNPDCIPEYCSYTRNHLGYAGVCKLIEEIKPRTAIISHFGSQLLSQVDDIQTSLRTRFSHQEVNIFCAHTGDEFIFEQSLDLPPYLGSFRP